MSFVGIGELSLRTAPIRGFICRDDKVTSDARERDVIAVAPIQRVASLRATLVR